MMKFEYVGTKRNFFGFPIHLLTMSIIAILLAPSEHCGRKYLHDLIFNQIKKLANMDKLDKCKVCARDTLTIKTGGGKGYLIDQDKGSTPFDTRPIICECK